MVYIVALLGLCLGSFLNVVIHRVPRRQSVVQPASHCTHCAETLRPWHLVPVLSFLMLRGRCAWCGVRVSWRYPLIEALAALVLVGVYLAMGPTLEAVRYGVLGMLLLAAAEIDRCHGIIPNRLVAWGVGLGALLLAGFWGLDPLTLSPLDGLGAACSAAALLLALRGVGTLFFGRPGVGLGDVKLAFMIGLFLGWTTLWVLYLALLLAGLLSIAGLLAGRLTRQTHLPMAPFMALGALLSLYLSPELVLLLVYGG
ncbi:MAG: prepilin peptidase [Bacteroidota bacterium]